MVELRFVVSILVLASFPRKSYLDQAALLVPQDILKGVGSAGKEGVPRNIGVRLGTGCDIPRNILAPRNRT